MRFLITFAFFYYFALNAFNAYSDPSISPNFCFVLYCDCTFKRTWPCDRHLSSSMCECAHVFASYSHYDVLPMQIFFLNVIDVDANKTAGYKIYLSGYKICFCPQWFCHVCDPKNKIEKDFCMTVLFKLLYYVQALVNRALQEILIWVVKICLDVLFTKWVPVLSY